MKAPPNIILEERKLVTKTNWLKVCGTKVTFHYPDDSQSKMTTVDRAYRELDDAVVIVAWFRAAKPMLYLRSVIRPPIALRQYDNIPESPEIGNCWELPAGLVEKREDGLAGLKEAAARELQEEVGFDYDPSLFALLGKRSFPAGGISGERLFFFHIEVNPWSRGEPKTDGSPFEKFGEVIDISVEDALDAVKQGYIYDAKTEIGIRRLADFLKINS